MTAKGRPLHLQLTQGQRHESTVARDLLEYAKGRYFLADAGYDSNDLIDAVREVGMKPVICPNGARKVHKGDRFFRPAICEARPESQST